MCAWISMFWLKLMKLLNFAVVTARIPEMDVGIHFLRIIWHWFLKMKYKWMLTALHAPIDARYHLSKHWGAIRGPSDWPTWARSRLAYRAGRFPTSKVFVPGSVWTYAALKFFCNFAKGIVSLVDKCSNCLGPSFSLGLSGTSVRTKLGTSPLCTLRKPKLDFISATVRDDFISCPTFFARTRRCNQLKCINCR